MDTLNSSKAQQPSDASLPFNATDLFKALQYQLLVAVEYCYDLLPNECVWIEVLGDVTVPGKNQTEVKNFSDSLTDSHTNFWNTVKNWLHEDFDRTSYKSLILLTTQGFGAQSTLKSWNTATAADRLEIMQKIASGAQNIVKKDSITKEKSKNQASQKPSKSQVLQQYVMDPERRDELMEVLERMHISTGQDSLEQRIQKYQTRHLKPIRVSKYQNFMDDLLGFIGSTKLVSEGWQITHQAFTDKLSELTSRYMKHPKTFPPVDTAALKKTINMAEVTPMLFAKKIIEIGAEFDLKKAALYRLIAQTTISDLYKDGVVFKPTVDQYLANHLGLHNYGRQSAMLDCAEISCESELKKRSTKFYLECNKAEIEPFCGLQNTMVEFRNGVYHILAGETPEDEDDEFHWRLW